MTPPVLARLLRDTLHGWWEDKAPRLGAALAYYTVLALAPVLIIVSPLASVIFGRERAHESIRAEFSDLVGSKGAAAVDEMLRALNSVPAPTSLAKGLSVLLLIFAASAVFAQLQDALNTIWEVTPRPGKAALLSFLRQRFLSFAMVFGISFLLLVSLVISSGLASLRWYFSPDVRALAVAWTVVNLIVSFAVITFLFAMIYKILPDVQLLWRDVWTGAALTAGLFEVGKFFIGAYLGTRNFGSQYGGVGSLVVLLVWVYYSAQILYLGAEFTKVYSHYRRQRAHVAQVEPAPLAVPVTEEARAQQGIPHEADVKATAEILQHDEKAVEAAAELLQQSPARAEVAAELLKHDEGEIRAAAEKAAELTAELPAEPATEPVAEPPAEETKAGPRDPKE